MNFSTIASNKNNSLSKCFNFELMDTNLNLIIELINKFEPYYIGLIIINGLIGNTVSLYLFYPNIFKYLKIYKLSSYFIMLYKNLLSILGSIQ